MSKLEKKIISWLSEEKIEILKKTPTMLVIAYPPNLSDNYGRKIGIHLDKTKIEIFSELNLTSDLIQKLDRENSLALKTILEYLFLDRETFFRFCYNNDKILRAFLMVKKLYVEELERPLFLHSIQNLYNTLLLSNLLVLQYFASAIGESPQDSILLSNERSLNMYG